MARTTTPNNWTAHWKARRAQLLEPQANTDAEAPPAETFNELRARAKAAGVSAAEAERATATLEARLEELG